MIKKEYVYNGYVTKVVDGDTVDIRVDLGFKIFGEMRFRLSGVDTKEVTDKDPVNRRLAMDAKQYVYDNYLNRQVTIKTTKPDKYGRFLAEIWVPGDIVSLNEKLITNGYAVAYFGGKKE